MFGGLLILLGVAWVVLALMGTAVLAHALTHPPRITVGTAVARGWPADPDEAGVGEWVVRRLPREGGGEMEFWDVAGDVPEGPVVLALHGWGDGRIGALQWMDVLRVGASRVWFFDLRGHGRDPLRFMWGSKEIEDVRGAIGFISSCYPGKDIALFGYSFGAVLAIRVAAELKDRELLVVADSLYENMEDVVGRVLRKKKLPRWPVVPMAMAWLGFVHGVPTNRSTKRDAERLTCPLLVIHGEKDTLVPTSEAAAVASAAQAGRMEVFNDCGHLEGAAHRAGAYVEVLKEFLKRMR